MKKLTLLCHRGQNDPFFKHGLKPLLSKYDENATILNYSLNIIFKKMYKKLTLLCHPVQNYPFFKNDLRPLLSKYD